MCVSVCVSRREKLEEGKFGMNETGKERREKKSLCGFECRGSQSCLNFLEQARRLSTGNDPSLAFTFSQRV